MKTVRGLRRLLKELPQPARSSFWIIFAAGAAAIFSGAVIDHPWAVLPGVAVAGGAAAVTGWCLLRDFRGSAAIWVRIYRETRGIPAGAFSMTDVPTIKAMGFFYLMMGVVWLGGAGWALLNR